MKTLASVKEYGDHVYITCPVGLYEPERAEVEAFAFAPNLREAAPNPKILWLRGQYVEADQPNRNADEWTAGELTIKALTPVLMPITVMHDLRSAVGTIADAKLLTPETDKVPRARIDTALAVWEHRFPDVAEEARINASQGTLMQSMECVSPFYECSVCGVSMRRHADWETEWTGHVTQHRLEATANADRSPSRRLQNVTFTGVGLIFGTRGARGAMPDSHLHVEELAAMHREAHASTTPAKKFKPQRRKGTMEIEDSKYEALVAAKAEGETNLAKLATAQTALTAAETKITALEVKVVDLEAAKVKAEAEAETAKETARVAAMRDERMSALGSGFRAKLDKLETTSKLVAVQAAKYSDEEWAARLTELEETLAVKRDAKSDAAAEPKLGPDGKPIVEPADPTAGLLFTKDQLAASAVNTQTADVTAGDLTTEPTVERRASVMSSLIHKPKAAVKA